MLGDKFLKDIVVEGIKLKFEKVIIEIKFWERRSNWKMLEKNRKAKRLRKICVRVKI